MGKNITKIDNVSNELFEYSCSNNQITKIENLPNNLQQFSCHSYQITKIINLPNSLIIFKFYGNSVNKIENLPISKYKSLSLKNIMIDYILTKNFDLSLEKIPIDLIDYINSFKKKCFNCQKIKPIHCKLYKNHVKWKVRCIYLYCWNCKNKIN